MNHRCYVRGGYNPSASISLAPPRRKSMRTRKRRRAQGKSRGASRETTPSPSPSPACELPVDVLLEIALRAGFATLLRCGATCRSLRSAIHGPDLARRVSSSHRGGVLPPSRLLCFLDGTDGTFSLAHPAAAPAAASVVEHHLAPFVSRSAGDLLTQYEPVASRGRLLLLERRAIVNEEWRSPERMPGICVYDPMTGGRTFLPSPPDIARDHCTYALLTAGDGIGCSFLLLAVDTWGLGYLSPFRVQAMRSDDGKWGPITHSYHPHLPRGTLLGRGNSTVVLDRVVHWLISCTDHILTYDAGTSAVASIKLPKDRLPGEWRAAESCLGSSPDGRLTLMYMMQTFIVSVLVMSAGGDWARHMEVDTRATVWSLMTPPWGRDMNMTIWIDLESSGDQRSGAVLMRLQEDDGHEQLLVLDMETKQIHSIGDKWGITYEVDMVSRLSATKIEDVAQQ